MKKAVLRGKRFDMGNRAVTFLIVRRDTNACGLCRYLSHRPEGVSRRAKGSNTPRVLGHEIAGAIETIGEGVTGLNPGQAVLHPGVFCGSCPGNVLGMDQVCPDMRIFGFHLDGGFQEVVTVPAAAVRGGCVLPLPKTADLANFVLAEPLACALHMEARLSAFGKDRLLIIGGGVLGLLTAMLWRHRGRGPVTIAEVDRERRAIGVELGFTVVCPAKIGENQFDAAIPCCPENAAFSLALCALRPRGQFGFFSGLTAENLPERADVNLLHYKELALFGAYGCGLADTREAVRLLLAGFPAKALPRRILPPENLAEALQNLELQTGLLQILTFEKESEEN